MAPGGAAGCGWGSSDFTPRPASASTEPDFNGTAGSQTHHTPNDAPSGGLCTE